MHNIMLSWFRKLNTYVIGLNVKKTVIGRVGKIMIFFEKKSKTWI